MSSKKKSSRGPSISQKEFLLQNRLPNQQIVRLPTSITWTGPVAGVKGRKKQTVFDPLAQPFIEIRVNQPDPNEFDYDEFEDLEVIELDDEDSEDTSGSKAARENLNEDDPGSDETSNDQILTEEEEQLLEYFIERAARGRNDPINDRYLNLVNDPNFEEKKRQRRLKASEYKRKQKAAQLKNETPEERQARLVKQRERQRRFYAKETEEQRRRRLNKVREYQRVRKGKQKGDDEGEQDEEDE